MNRKYNLQVFLGFHSLFVDFNARFPGSLQTCQLPFQVQKLDVHELRNKVRKYISVFELL
jgi:hypothetical protein